MNREERNAKAEEIRSMTAELLESTQNKNFLKRRDWGAINFTKSQEVLEAARRLWEDMKGKEWEVLPDDMIQKVVSNLTSMKTSITQVTEFSLSGNPEGTRDQIANQVEAEHWQLTRTVVPSLGFLAYREGDIEGKLEEATRVGTELAEKRKAEEKAWNAEREEHRRQMEADRNATKEIQEQIRQTASELGVGTFTDEFMHEAKSAGQSAKKWLWGAAAAAAGAAGTLGSWTAVQVTTAAQRTGGTPPIAEMVSVGALVGILVYIAGWCGRMFRVNKHNEVTNRHRALSLKTVQAFSEAARSGEAKEAVLMGAAKCIFEARSTGLATEPLAAPTTTTQIIETTRKALGSGNQQTP